MKEASICVIDRCFCSTNTCGKSETWVKHVHKQKIIFVITIPNQLGVVNRLYSNGIVLITVSYLFGFVVFVVTTTLHAACRPSMGCECGGRGVENSQKSRLKTNCILSRRTHIKHHSTNYNLKKIIC